jgi:hypothetical protein
MAKGKITGRNHLPRLSSPEGTEARQENRRATMPKAKHRGEYTMPGSRNLRKVGR